MSTWFSEYRVRTLAEHIAPRILPKVEAALGNVFREHLPGMLMEAIRAEIGTEHAPKGSAAARRDRDALRRRMRRDRDGGALRVRAPERDGAGFDLRGRRGRPLVWDEAGRLAGRRPLRGPAWRRGAFVGSP